MTTKEIRAEAHKEITYIFEELLPQHGYSESFVVMCVTDQEVELT